MAEDGGQHRYAVLGWGSLIWDLDTLAPHVRLPWRMGAGPRLPMEFSRVSPKRRMGLVVCLDPAGVPCPTHAVASTRDRLGDAIADLAHRERAPAPRIGGVCLATGAAQGREAIAAAVRDWCGKAGWTGAVWTDLLPNYAEMLGEAFSIERGAAYLRTLAGENLDQAVRYIENAPATTDTPLRRRPGGPVDAPCPAVGAGDGLEGQARPRVPAAFAAFTGPLTGRRVRHSSEPLDRAALRGRRVVVIGLSASAFDNACVGAEPGVDVVLLGRADRLPAVNKMKQTV